MKRTIAILLLLATAILLTAPVPVAPKLGQGTEPNVSQEQQPLKPFVPSEELPPGGAVSFPVDI